ncbi:hypothetical protein EMIT0P176_100096 [Pseudomonas sp. IT-P176]
MAWTSTRVREGRKVPPETATTFSGVLMGCVPVRVGDVQPSEQESFHGLNNHINQTLMVFLQGNCCCLGSELLGDCCPGNSGDRCCWDNIAQLVRGM